MNYFKTIFSILIVSFSLGLILGCNKKGKNSPSTGKFDVVFNYDNFLNDKKIIIDIIEVEKTYFLSQFGELTPDKILKNKTKISGLIYPEGLQDITINGEIINKDFMTGSFVENYGSVGGGNTNSTGTFTIKKQ